MQREVVRQTMRDATQYNRLQPSTTGCIQHNGMQHSTARCARQVQHEVVQRTMRDLRVGSPQTIARMEENARRTGGAHAKPGSAR